MRLTCAAVVAVLSLAIPAQSYAQTSLDGFGALPMNQVSSLGDSGVPFDFGGASRVRSRAWRAGDGRVRTARQRDARIHRHRAGVHRLNLKASAFYGEGGVRLLAAPRSAVSPYVEGSAGVAHLRFGVNGLGSATDAIVRAALNIVDTRDPIVGGGGGVLLQGGPLQIDLGYRYKRILADSTLSSFISDGQKLDSQQIRFGVGLRF